MAMTGPANIHLLYVCAVLVQILLFVHGSMSMRLIHTLSVTDIVGKGDLIFLRKNFTYKYRNNQSGHIYHT